MAVGQFEINLTDAEFIIENVGDSFLDEIDEDIVANAASRLEPDILAYAQAIMASIVEYYVRSDIEEIMSYIPSFGEKYGENTKVAIASTKPFKISDDQFIDTEGGWYMIPEAVYKECLKQEQDFGLPEL